MNTKIYSYFCMLETSVNFVYTNLQFNETILYLFKKHNNLIIGLVSIAQNINIYKYKYYMLKITTSYNKYNNKKKYKDVQNIYYMFNINHKQQI